LAFAMTGLYRRKQLINVVIKVTHDQARSSQKVNLKPTPDDLDGA
jgi:hypothetical protein